MLRRTAFAACLIGLFIAKPAEPADIGLATLPLTVPVRTAEILRRDFSTIGELTDYLVTRVGYRLALADPAPPEARHLYLAPINPAIYARETLTIEEILSLALPAAITLVVDVRARLVSWEYAAPRPAVSSPFAYRAAGGHLP